MYESYPRNKQYSGDPRNESPFTLRADPQELSKWDMELDHQEAREMRETLTADRVSPVPEMAMPTRNLLVQAAVQTNLNRRG